MLHNLLIFQKIPTCTTLLHSAFLLILGKNSCLHFYSILHFYHFWKTLTILQTYRIRLIKAPGFYFSKWIFGWGSIQIWSTWGCIQAGVLFIKDPEERWGSDYCREMLTLIIWNYMFSKFRVRVRSLTFKKNHLIL